MTDEPRDVTHLLRASACRPRHAPMTRAAFIQRLVDDMRSRGSTLVVSRSAPGAPPSSIEPLEIRRLPVGPPCRWCGLPLEQRADGSQARCGCGLP